MQACFVERTWSRALCPPCVFVIMLTASVAMAQKSDSGQGREGQFANEQADKFIDLLAQRTELETQLELAELLRPAQAGDAVSVAKIFGNSQLDTDTKQTLEAIFSDQAQDLAHRLQEFGSSREAESESLKRLAKRMRAERNRAEIEHAAVVANRSATAKVASLVSLDNRWFWLSGVGAFSILVGVVFHDRRHEIRRLLQGARARSMLLSKVLFGLFICLIAITSVTFFFGDAIFRSLTEDQTLELRSYSKIEEDTHAAEQACERLRQQLQSTGVQSGSSVGQVQSDELWETAHALSHRTLVTLRIQRQVATQLKHDADELENLRDQEIKIAGEIAGYRSFKMWLRAGIGSVLFGLVAFSSSAFLRGVGRRNGKNARTCPVCLGEDTLEQESHGTGRSKFEMIKCNNVLSEDPYEECNFSFRSVYRDMPKICFPTLGHPQSGKTHWLAMTYRELNQGKYPENVQFDRIRSDSSDELDRIVEDIIMSRLDPAATMVERIPRPVLFNFRDQDRIGPSNILVSIFDYSGEVLQRMDLNDSQRRRALDADGYLFFLDPTQSADEQVEELINFREDVRAIRNVRTGQALRAPVALCVSKIDLLVNEEYADPDGGGPVGHFYKALAEIDPTNEGLTLDIIEARSKLVSELRDTIWPGWQIEKQIHEMFGGRCRFFPLTPVGMNELGETELRNRLIEPFGILDPLMWLLHMNGYPVLK